MHSHRRPYFIKISGFSNKTSYLYFRLYVNWRFMRGIQTQFTQLQKGFQELVSQHLLRPFDERELEVWASYRIIVHDLYIDKLVSL